MARWPIQSRGDTMTISEEQQRILLTMARQAIEQAAHGRPAAAIDLDALPEALQEERATFVTLTQPGGRLRGCIGSLEPRRPLALDVRENAVAAATQDPRFPPVQPVEVDDLHIEISVLSIPQPLEYDGPEDLLSTLRPHIDGVLIQRGWQRGTFLPQVWEKLPDPHTFMEHLCRKAYLPPDAYHRPGLDVYTYQVEKFEEE